MRRLLEELHTTLNSQMNSKKATAFCQKWCCSFETGRSKLIEDKLVKPSKVTEEVSGHKKKKTIFCLIIYCKVFVEMEYTIILEKISCSVQLLN